MSVPRHWVVVKAPGFKLKVSSKVLELVRPHGELIHVWKGSVESAYISGQALYFSNEKEGVFTVPM